MCKENKTILKRLVLLMVLLFAIRIGIDYFNHSMAPQTADMSLNGTLNQTYITSNLNKLENLYYFVAIAGLIYAACPVKTILAKHNNKKENHEEQN